MVEELFSEELRRRNQDVWEAMTGHRFTRDVEEDRLAPSVFRRYLGFERAFVEAAVVIFGYALVRAPGIAEQKRLAEVLRALTVDQLDYFARTFAALGMPEEAWREAGLPGEAAGLRDGMIGFAAHGGYEEVVAAMLAAEWMYWTWCTRAGARAIGDPQVREWVDLHTGPGFADQVRWLRRQVDGFGPYLAPHRRERCLGVFRRALELEIAFHDAPYKA